MPTAVSFQKQREVLAKITTLMKQESCKTTKLLIEETVILGYEGPTINLPGLIGIRVSTDSRLTNAKRNS